MLVVLDYGIGNVRSVLNALAYLGIPATLSRDAGTVRSADALILPGVGAFGEGMRRIDAYGLRDLIDETSTGKKPILGICLGFELLMQSSDELGSHEGLGLFSLPVHRLSSRARLPHIGWSPVRTSASSVAPARLLAGIEGESFYFVHSYGVETIDSSYTTASASYGGAELVAIIERDHIFGAQFHPEKSGEAGLQLLQNFHEVYR